MIQDLLTPAVLAGIVYSGIRLATPYLYATLGETIGQLSGVLNLGVEGIMLMGAYAGFYLDLPHRQSVARPAGGDRRRRAARAGQRLHQRDA